MKRTMKAVFYLAVFAASFLMVLYGVRHEPELLRMIGVQSAQAKGNGEPDFQLLYQAYGIVHENYVESLDKDGDGKKMEYGAIRGLLKSVGDPYTRFIDPTAYKNMMIETKGEFGGIGITIGINKMNQQLTVIAPLEGTPAAKIGLKAGDIIMKVNGVSTEDMALDDAVSRIRGPKNEKVKLTIWRPGFEDDGKDFDIVRDTIVLKPVNKTKMMEGKIGYVRLESFSENSAPEIEEGIKQLKKEGMKAFILDLRYNPGGLLPAAIDVSRLFIDEGPIVHRQNRSGKLVTYYAQTGGRILDLPMVVLVNHYSASASEIVSGALQDHGVATIMGETTYGKGLVQSIFRLDDDSAILVTTDKYLTAKKRDINKLGIVPDIVVKAGSVDSHTGKQDSEDADSQGKVGKFQISELKSNGVILNGAPVKDISYKQFGGKHYLEIDDVAKLFNATSKIDDKTKILAIDQNKETIDDEKNDIQLKRALEYLKEKTGQEVKKTDAPIAPVDKAVVKKTKAADKKKK